jgi:hypothetical protein
MYCHANKLEKLYEGPVMIDDAVTISTELPLTDDPDDSNESELNEYLDRVALFLKDKPSNKAAIEIVEALISRPLSLLKVKLLVALRRDKSGRFKFTDDGANSTVQLRLREKEIDSEANLNVHGYRNKIEIFLNTHGPTDLTQLGAFVRKPEALKSLGYERDILEDDPKKRFVVENKVVSLRSVHQASELSSDDTMRSEKNKYQHPWETSWGGPVQTMPKASSNHSGNYLQMNTNVSVKQEHWGRETSNSVESASGPSIQSGTHNHLEFTREANNKRRIDLKNLPLAESTGDMKDPKLCAVRLRDFIIGKGGKFITAKKTGDIRDFYILYPEYEALISKFGGLKLFCNLKGHRDFVWWKEPKSKTDQIPKIWVAMKSL